MSWDIYGVLNSGHYATVVDHMRQFKTIGAISILTALVSCGMAQVIDSSHVKPIGLKKDTTSHTMELKPDQCIALATAYRDRGRFKEAEETYMEGIRQADGRVRYMLLDSLILLVKSEKHETDSSEEYGKAFRSGISTIVSTSVTAIGTSAALLIVILLFLKPLDWVGRFRGRGILSMEPIKDQSKDKSAQCFEEIICNTLEEMRYDSGAFGAIGEPLTLPRYLDAQATWSRQIPQLLNDPVASRFAGWVQEKLRIAEYSIGGFLIEEGPNLRAEFKLERWGHRVGTWAVTIPVPNTYDGQKDLAFVIILKLKEVVVGGNDV